MRLLAVLALVLVSHAAQAQAPRGWGLQLRGGGAAFTGGDARYMAVLQGADHDDFAFRQAFDVGAFAHFPFNDRLGIQIEAAYVERGSLQTVEGPVGPFGDYEFRLRYTQLGTIGRVVLAPAASDLALEVGAAYGVLSANRGTFTPANPSTANPVRVRNGGVDMAMSLFDVSGVVGLSVRPVPRLGVGIRYQRGLQPVGHSDLGIDKGTAKTSAILGGVSVYL